MGSCCWECVNDEVLRELIHREGEVDECVGCGSSRRRAIDGEALGKLLWPIVSTYSDPLNFMPMEFLKEGEHPTLAQRLTDDFDIFDDYDITVSVLNICDEGTSDPFDGEPSRFDPHAAAYNESTWFTGDHEQVIELRDTWADLKQTLMYINRHFPGDSIDSIGNVLWASKGRISRKTRLFRARKSPESGRHSRQSIGAPPKGKSTGGRCNPASISYLYLASDETTAASEIRPHVGDGVDVAEFRLERDVVVVDLRSPRIGSPFSWGDRYPEVAQVMPFLVDLGVEMSRPVSSDRREVEYIPTQYLCEWIKSLDYDGIAYASGVANGWNLALFDPSIAKARQPQRYDVSRVVVSIK